ncbi:MAG: hypothetical protein KGL39_12120 [Patescibacteria group bacterium]|nr:hypothetical protein [Patescibacteria group bacterium]
MKSLKRGIGGALLAWLFLTAFLGLAWVIAIDYHWGPSESLWAAVWLYHAFLLFVIGAVAVIVVLALPNE